MRTPEQTLARLRKHVVVLANGCHQWTGALVHGYAKFQMSYKTMRGHRIAYEIVKGPIPPGLVLDHLCRNKACVNPDHLEPVTDCENILRSDNPAARNARATHCKRGHEFNAKNTLYTPGKRGRQCRVCNRDRWRRLHGRQSEGATV